MVDDRRLTLGEYLETIGAVSVAEVSAEDKQARWDEYFFGIARQAAAKSKDRSVKVGCLIAGPDKEIRSTGFNGFPRGVDDDKWERHQRPLKYKWTEHAERNAIYACSVRPKGCTLYVMWHPCMDCARAIVQSGITALVCEKPDYTDPRWGGDFNLATELFGEAGVSVRYINDK